MEWYSRVSWQWKYEWKPQTKRGFLHISGNIWWLAKCCSCWEGQRERERECARERESLGEVQFYFEPPAGMKNKHREWQQRES